MWGVWGERFLPHPPTPPTLLNAPCPMPNALLYSLDWNNFKLESIN
ncbi:hypothetical protein H6G98_15750 [Nostoc sp. FACHB-857]|nr:hypothetical protein [Nostoc sp. FACHB-857]